MGGYLGRHVGLPQLWSLPQPKTKVMETKRYKSILGQMVYVLIAGLQLLFIPNILLGLFGIAPTSEIWIRVLGMLVLVLSIYYYSIYKSDNKEVVRATVQGRLLFCAGLVMFVVLGMAPVTLILFAVLETGLALWSLAEIRKS